MNQNELKKAVAQEAVKYVKPNSVLGVGTGSTVNCFIDALAPIKDQIKAAVSELYIRRPRPFLFPYFPAAGTYILAILSL